MIDQSHLQEFAGRFKQLHDNISTVIRGKDRQISMALFALFAEGHLLLEDKPGTGKTSLAKAITRSIGGSWNRIQFTPDLLPSDITGTLILRQGELVPKIGPIHANIVLADEINRASPKTQSALLQAMEEKQITIDDQIYDLPRPFVVIATQNPVEQEGTYRLPEAQLDRFMLRTELGYPDLEAEVDVLRSHAAGVTSEQLSPVYGLETVQWMIQVSAAVPVAPEVQRYIVRLSRATRVLTEEGHREYDLGDGRHGAREREDIDRIRKALRERNFELPVLRLGVSTRGSVSMMRAAQAVAASQASEGVTPEHVNFIARSIMAHRMALTSQAELDGLDRGELADLIANSTSVDLMRGR
ncbi:MAG: AAA family ATPase [Actinomycetota bacterium]